MLMLMLLRLLLVIVLVLLTGGAAATATATAAATATATIVTTIASPSLSSSSASASTTAATTTTRMMLRGGDEDEDQAHNQPHAHRLLATAYNAAAASSSDNNNSTVSVAMESAKEYVNTFQQNTQNIVSTHPKEWTTNQIIIVCVVFGLFWTLLLLLWFCCVRRWCCGNNNKNKNSTSKDNNNDYTTEEKKKTSHEMTRPYVKRIGTRSTGSPLTYGGNFLDATDINKLPLGARLHGAVQLRRNNLDGQNIRIAVIDSGIDSAHPGFHGSINSEKYWFRYGTPLSKDDHGTHVAGTIHFMAPKAEIYDYRVFGEDGDIDGNTAVVKSIRHAVDKTKCHVINMSLSVGYPVRTDIQKAIQYAYKKGVHMVCAAGNDGDGNPTTDEIYSYPAIYKETISVAAVHKEDGFLLDATTFSESNSSINYSGIGSNVVSLKPGGGIQTMSGTSMAAPHITGLIACLMSNNNSTKYNTDKKLRTLLNTTYVIDIGEEGYDKQTGKGFLSYLAGNESDKDDFIDLLSFVAN